MTPLLNLILRRQWDRDDIDDAQPSTAKVFFYYSYKGVSEGMDEKGKQMAKYAVDIIESSEMARRVDLSLSNETTY